MEAKAYSSADEKPKIEALVAKRLVDPSVVTAANEFLDSLVSKLQPSKACGSEYFPFSTEEVDFIPPTGVVPMNSTAFGGAFSLTRVLEFGFAVPVHSKEDVVPVNYFAMRTALVVEVATQLYAVVEEGVGVSIEFLYNDERKPILVLDWPASPKRRWLLHLMPFFEPEMPVEKAVKLRLKGVNPDNVSCWPAVMEDGRLRALTELLQGVSAAVPAFSTACVLLAQWLHNRGFQDSFLAVSQVHVLLAHLCLSKTPSIGATSSQLVEMLLTWLSHPPSPSMMGVQGPSMGVQGPPLLGLTHPLILFDSKTKHYNCLWRLQLHVQELSWRARGSINTSFEARYVHSQSPMLPCAVVAKSFVDFHAVSELPSVSFASDDEEVAWEETILKPASSSIGPDGLPLAYIIQHRHLNHQGAAMGHAQWLSLLCRRALKSRVLSMVVRVTNGDSSAEVAVGVIIESPDSLSSFVERGPLSNTAQGKAFGRFWGSACETRRFHDGSVCEAVMLERRPAANHVTFPDGCLPSPPAVQLLSKALQSQASWDVEAGCIPFGGLSLPHCTTEIDNQINELSLTLMSKQGLPLTVAEIHFTGAVMARAETPLRKPKFGDTPAFAEGYIEFEASSKWPADAAAVQRLKTALLLAITDVEGLRRHTSEDFVDVVLKHLVVRLRIFVPVLRSEQAILVSNFNPTWQSRPSAHEFAEFRREWYLPRIQTYLRNFGSENAAFFAGCRLVRGWFQAQGFGGYELLADHLVVAVFESTADKVICENLVLTPPVVLESVLRILTHFKFDRQPLYVGIGCKETHVTGDTAALLQSAYFRNVKGMKPYVWVSSVLDPHCLLLTTPPIHAFRRLRDAATGNTLAKLSPKLPFGGDWKVLFRPRLHDLDFILDLNSLDQILFARTKTGIKRRKIDVELEALVTPSRPMIVEEARKYVEWLKLALAPIFDVYHYCPLQEQQAYGHPYLPCSIGLQMHTKKLPVGEGLLNLRVLGEGDALDIVGTLQRAACRGGELVKRLRA